MANHGSDEDAKKPEPFGAAVGKYDAQLLQGTVAMPQKVKRFPHDPASPLLATCLKETKTRLHECLRVHVQCSLMAQIHESQKVGLDDLCNTRTVDCHSAARGDECWCMPGLMLGWVTAENTMLRARASHTRPPTEWFLLYNKMARTG